ncbi:hypothetical protein ONZ45_g10242 [Pleurotus djamor]|nr:hypothetical protein ONZ45_g10242 [Pleurotus djamor]
MDPLSIATTIVSAIEIGLRVKASIDKIGRNRRRSRELIDDVLATLDSLQDFYESNRSSFEATALNKLNASLASLMTELLEVHSCCKRYERRETSGRFRRLASGLKTWMAADDLEIHLLRLRESIHSSLIRVNLLISARNEVALARIEQSLLVRPSESRRQVQQLDSLLGQGVYERDSNILSIDILHSENIGDLDRQYVRLKSRNIASALQTRPSSISVNVDPFEYVYEYEYLVLSEEKEPSPETLISIVSQLAEVWQSLGTEAEAPQCSLVSLLFLAHDMVTFRCTDIAACIYDTLESIIRQILKGRDKRHDEDNLLSWLCFILRRKIYMTSSELEETKLALEITQIRRSQMTCSTSRSTPTLRRFRLNRALQRLITQNVNSGDYQGAIETCTEALDVLRNDATLEVKSTALITQLNPSEAASRCCALQSFAFTLYLYSRSLELNGDYTRAVYTGMDTVRTIQMLSETLAMGTPADFDNLNRERSYLERNLASWNTICWPLSSQSKESEEDDAITTYDNPPLHLVQWGIAC